MKTLNLTAANRETHAKIETYQELERIAKSGSKLRGDYEVRCCGLVIGRFANLAYAVQQAKNLEKRIDAKVTVHYVGKDE